MPTTISKYGLSLQHVTKGFVIGGQERAVFSGLNYRFLPGVSYAVVGASGSGKSTLLHILAGFESVDAGDVMWGEKLVRAMTRPERDAWASKHIGFAFQFHYLIAELTVYQNIALSAALAGISENAEQVRAMIEFVGMQGFEQQYPHQLSGGQQQRAALARALIRKPLFLIADEPTGNLDTQTARMIIDVCIRYQKEYGMGLIIATHDQAVYSRMDTVVQL
jgi:ABC-type lipoprotein export system ATPase subunit